METTTRQKFTRSNAFIISAIALIVGAIGPWVTVLGLVNLGPTHSLEIGLIVFGGAGLIALSGLTGKFTRPASIIVGALVLAEAVNTLSKVGDLDEDLVSPGWGLYLSMLTAVFLIASTFIIKQTPMEKHGISKITTVDINDVHGA